MSLNEKVRFIEGMGVDYLVLYDFMDVKNFTAEEFVRHLVENYKMKKIICGFNFRFGEKNKGDVHYLKSIKHVYNYEVETIKPMKILNKRVSSTRIRTYIKFGEVEKVQKFLGRMFSIEDTVIRGKKLGRQFGFPTANVRFNNDYCIPQNGVYATITEFKDVKFSSMTNIGYNPTFKNKYMKGVKLSK